tara:strand:+ start:322 stop:504 length:183 start_codon:yes stop_codon:yes gene_type:complete
MYFFILNLGFGEILIIALVYLICFGSKGFPELMRDFGRIFFKLKQSLYDLSSEINSSTKK